MSPRNRSCVALLAAALVLPAPGQEADQPPVASGLTERVETRILQVDVSVVDRKAGRYRSVPGLTKEMFRLRVDGKRLTTEEYERIAFDEVCGPPGTDLPVHLDLRSLIVMLDFNYLDGQMRFHAAQALRQLAEEGLPEGYKAKVIGYTRSLFEIQPFTNDPADLMRAADFIETVSGLGGPPLGETAAMGGTAAAEAAAIRQATARAATPPLNLGQEILPPGGPALDPVNPSAPPAEEVAPVGTTPGETAPTYSPEGGSQVLDPATADTQLRQKLQGLPNMVFGPNLSSDPWRAKGNEPNPGLVAPDSVIEELQNSRSFDRVSTSFEDIQSMVDQLVDLVPESPGRALVERDLWRQTRASLAAIEAVLRGHAGLRGRKALVVFTGEGFELPNPDDLERESKAVFQAAQESFSIWIVDAQGMYWEGERSDLITMLANDTGGGTLRGAPDLSTVFPLVQEALACYYLFSIPVPMVEDEGRSLSVSVSLDTRTYPDLFPYNVQHGTRYRLAGPVEERELTRTAALLNPGDWQTLPIRAELAFPQEQDRRLSYLPVEVSIPLESLTFQPAPEGGVEARFLADLAVDRNGFQTTCLLPPKGEANLHRIVLPRALPSDHRGHLVIRDLCPYRGRGLYTLRAVITDTGHDAPGAAHALYQIDPRPGPTLSVTALRAGHNTGSEHLLTQLRSGQAKVPRDVERTAFVPLLAGDAARPGDTMMFRYVLCGPSREEAKDCLRRLVYRKRGSRAEIMFRLSAAAGGGEARYAPSPFCVEIEDALPPNTLQAGDYGFAVVSTAHGPSTRTALETALARGEGAGLLGRIEFKVD
jgi:VWFA-related protein